MKSLYYLVLIIFLGLDIFASGPNIVRYKEQNIKKINSYLQNTEDKTIWNLLELLKLDELGQIKSIPLYPLFKDTIDNYRRTYHYFTFSDWIGLFTTYLNDTYSNANIYKVFSGDISSLNSYPIDIKWAIVPQRALNKIKHGALNYHARNGKILSSERISIGYMPHSMDIKIIIDDFIDPLLETEEIIENVFRFLKAKLKDAHEELNHAFVSRSELNKNLLHEIMTKIENDELPVSHVMGGPKTQDPVIEMLHRWDWSLDDNTSKYYSVQIISIYLSKSLFNVPPQGNPFFTWPKMEDFEGFKKLYMLEKTENKPEIEEAYFKECYKDTVNRFATFKEKYKLANQSQKMKIENLPNFIPELRGFSSPVRMTIFEYCHNKDSWEFTNETECYQNNKEIFKELFERKDKFIATLEIMWSHIVQLFKVYYDRGFITHEEFKTRKIEVKDGKKDFFDSQFYSIISRLFLDKDIDIVDNKLLLQLEENQLYEQTLVYSLKRLLTHFDNALVNLADLYLTRDQDLIFNTKKVLTTKIQTIDKDIVEIPIKYIEAENNEISFKSDRDMLWGLLLAQAPLPSSRNQIQGSCATNAFLNVYSRLQRTYPELVMWDEQDLVDTLVTYSSNEWTDLRDGMRNGRDHNFYDGALRKISNNSLTWVYAPTITREETAQWLKEKFQNGQAVYFGTKINYDGFPFIDIIDGGWHAVTIVGMSDIPEVTDEIYVFISDSNNYFYTIPLETLLDYSQFYISMDFGYASGDPSFNMHKKYGNNATFKTIEFINY